MKYPNTPGFQAHSETSQEAAEQLQADTLRNAIFDDVSLHGHIGRTADELSDSFEIPASTIAARLRELELAGRVVKTAQKRKTRWHRNAFVYVTPANHTAQHGRAKVKPEKPCDIMQMEAEHTRMKNALLRLYADKKELPLWAQATIDKGLGYEH
jgi:predicted transcriptional regulator|nr:MAG TPA: hypothetical protein [Caudoviricetes sp.]